jgi:hypothetical protein
MFTRFRTYTPISHNCWLPVLWIPRNLLSNDICLVGLNSLLSPDKRHRINIVTKCWLGGLWTCWSDCTNTIFIQVNFLKRCIRKQILDELSPRRLNLRFVDKLNLFTSCLNGLALGKWILVIGSTNRVYKSIANIRSGLNLWLAANYKLTSSLVQSRSQRKFLWTYCLWCRVISCGSMAWDCVSVRTRVRNFAVEIYLLLLTQKYLALIRNCLKSRSVQLGCSWTLKNGIFFCFWVSGYTLNRNLTLWLTDICKLLTS